MRERTCCFTGHRKLPTEKIEAIIKCLNDEVEKLIDRGVTNFISGGALGFDQIAASLIIAKKEMGHKIRLIFALPCGNQDALWTDAQKGLYHGLLGDADEIVYVSEVYSRGCMEKRNQYMVEHSGYCICALLHSESGTGQTVRYAQQRGLRVVNVSE